MYATRKKVTSENVAPLGKKDGGLQNQIPGKTLQGKVKKVGVGQVKRPALGDIANADHDKLIQNEGKKNPVPLKPRAKPERTASISLKPTTKPTVKQPIVKQVTKAAVAPANKKVTSLKPETKGKVDKKTKGVEVLQDKNEIQTKDIVLDVGLKLERVEEDISFIEEGQEKEKELFAFDKENLNDVYHLGLYAQDIFDYYKNREKLFSIPAYMGPDYPVTPAMRAILVDWMVEIQENFELNHETLYLGVKLMDMYLSRTVVTKDDLQLVGAVALFVSSKFDEQRYPLIEDFTYVCDNAFNAEQFLEMEMSLLKRIDFDLGIPLSYRFLRRYARVGKISIETMSMARFILELSLLSAEFIPIQDSKIAAAALYLAMKMRKESEWVGDLPNSSGYELPDFKQVVISLNSMLVSPKYSQLKNSRSKFSHRVFFEVAKTPTIPNDKLFL